MTTKMAYDKVLWQQHLKHPELCDLTILVQNKHFKVHWDVMTVSPYFKDLRSSGMAESQSGYVELALTNPETVQQTIQWIYTGKTNKLSEEDAVHIVKLAKYLQLEKLVKKGERVLANGAYWGNCINLMNLAITYDLEKLKKAAHPFLYGTFPKVVAYSKQILDVSCDELLKYVKDVNLSYYSQARFYDLIVRWVEHDPDERAAHFEKLFAGLKLNFIPSEHMQRIKDSKIVTDNKTCCELIEKFESMVTKGEIDPYSHLKDVIVFGGIRESPEQYAYLIKENRWVKLPFLDGPYIGENLSGLYVSVIVNKELFVMHNFAWENRSRLLKLDVERWGWDIVVLNFDLPPVNFRKEDMLVAGCHGFICVLVPKRKTFLLKLYPTDPELKYKEVRLDGLIPAFVHGEDYDNELEMRQTYMCAINDEALFILTEIENIETQQKAIHCVCYKFASGEVVDCSAGAKLGDVVFCKEKSRVHIHKFYEQKRYVFDYKSKRWYQKARVLPPAPRGKEYFTSVSLIRDKGIYVFGDEKNAKKPCKKEAFGVTPKDRRWKKLAECPMVVPEKAVAMEMKLPASLACCPPGCCHCFDW